MSGILDAYGNTWTRVCDDASWKKISKGSVVVNFQWFTNEAMQLTNEPAMLFTCPTRGKGQNVAIITLGELGRYIDTYNGKDRATLNVPNTMLKAMQIVEAIGLDVFSRSDVHAVMDLIRDGLQELLNMPPKPAGMRNDGSAMQSIGAAEIVENGKVIKSEEILQ